MCFEVFQKKEVNITRQLNLDLLKVVATIAMILCHVVMQFGKYINGYDDAAAYIFSVVILGSYVAVAHAFMFCMGIGIMYSRKNSSKELLKRGLSLYIVAYILNFFRYTVYLIVEGLVVGTFREGFWYSLYIQDIFHFAGLAMMTTALLRKLKFNSFQIYLVSLIMSVLGSVIAFSSTGVTAWDVIFGSFFITTVTEAHFALFNWYVFVAFGMVFGDIIRRVQNLDKFYKYTTIVSGVIMVVYIILTKKSGYFFLTKNNHYYAVSIPEAIGFISIDLFIASICYFIQKYVNETKMTIFSNISKNVNSIYVIHWCIIGLMESVLCSSLGIVFPYWILFVFGAIITIVSYVLSMLWNNIKCRKINTIP